ncbi:MAG TPA: FUSC family protein [Nocardioides sp.]|nr:FUSC family protein [Nocardioides sp.]
MSWSWSSAFRGAVCAAPAAVVALTDVQLAAGLSVGLIPVLSLPLAPSRVARVRSGLTGVLAAVSVVAGGFLAQWPVLAVVGIVLAGGLLGKAAAARTGPGTLMALFLCLPLMAVGFSYPGTEKVVGLAADLLAGTAWAVLVGLAWPAHTAPAERTATLPPPWLLVPYGWVAGAVGATCAAIGFAADLEHVGWAPAAALLVMRPSAPVQRMRSLHRVGDVVLGAGAAVLLVQAEPREWVYAIAIGAAVTLAAATAASHWYVLPTFTTYFVFIMLLSGDLGDARERFWERVLETGLGIGVAAVASFVVLPALLRHRRDSAGSADATAR